GERALYPERFYRLAFAAAAGSDARGGGSATPRAAALYLPAIDIAGTGWQGSAMAFAELLEGELRAADRLLAAVLAEGRFRTVVVVVDPGRRGGREGRALWWRASGCGHAGDAAAPGGAGSSGLATVTPAAIGGGLFRATGLPQSAELPVPPPLC